MCIRDSPYFDQSNARFQPTHHLLQGALNDILKTRMELQGDRRDSPYHHDPDVSREVLDKTLGELEALMKKYSTSGDERMPPARKEEHLIENPDNATQSIRGNPFEKNLDDDKRSQIEEDNNEESKEEIPEKVATSPKPVEEDNDFNKDNAEPSLSENKGSNKSKEDSSLGKPPLSDKTTLSDLKKMEKKYSKGGESSDLDRISNIMKMNVNDPKKRFTDFSSDSDAV
eukprot:TRINITY_DN6310_c0_g1_i1.p1 TRINITY_DN6310_c0_g1~~TRINITY_DN6310_c0_g1_i1.p1  ORF type:complete len:228 (+),score=47.00 TRINITY_DN6310_c0_g1_i1:67-750(+)